MTGGGGADNFVYNGLADGTLISTNQTVADSGLATDIITDFTTLSDRILFNAGDFDAGGSFETLTEAYDGTNATATSGAAYIYDSDGYLIYDDDVTTAGYTVIADLGEASFDISEDILIPV